MAAEPTGRVLAIEELLNQARAFLQAQEYPECRGRLKLALELLRSGPDRDSTDEETERTITAMAAAALIDEAKKLGTLSSAEIERLLSDDNSTKV